MSVINHGRAVALLLSVRATALSVLWLVLFFCLAGFLVAVTLGLIFRSSKCWVTALSLSVVDLMLGLVIAILDHAGYAH